MSNPCWGLVCLFNLKKGDIVAKIDYLKERADKYKIIFKFILNAILAIFIGISGLIYGVVLGTIKFNIFIWLMIPLLIIFIKSAIMALYVWQKSDKIDDEILKEL